MRSAIGSRLLHIRAARTQPEMAGVLGVAPRTYAYYENGDRVPDGEALARLVAEGWNINWLLTGQGPERIPDGVDRQAAEDRAQALAGDVEAQARVRNREEAFFAGARWQRQASETASESHSQPLRRDALTMAVQLAQEALDGRHLDPPDYAELVDLIYGALVNGLPSAQVLAFARPAARGIGLRGETQNADPMDRPGEAAAGEGQ